MTKPWLAILFAALPALDAAAQDQQLGARTKAMGGSYTAFEDDPVSVWLNPAGIATQATQGSVAYQTYNAYPLHRDPGGNFSTVTGAEAETTLASPVFVPSYLGFVFQLGSPDSPMALGICYARPYFLRYSFDEVDDVFQGVFTPDSEMEQTFHRFRVAFAKDFRFRKVGEAGFLPHLAVGIGADAAFETWAFKTAGTDTSDYATSFGGGAGLLVGVYDNTETVKVNLGIAYQSSIRYDFNTNPSILPAFEMPQQLNVGMTFYLLRGMPLRLTVDTQWIDWSGVAENPRFSGQPRFEDALNFSAGAEYRVSLSENFSLYPRCGYRRFDAPWGNADDLPMVGNFKLVLDTKGDAFHIFTFGVGIAWSTESDKLRSVDLAGDVGGDSFNVAMGYNHEF